MREEPVNGAELGSAVGFRVPNPASPRWCRCSRCCFVTSLAPQQIDIDPHTLPDAGLTWEVRWRFLLRCQRWGEEWASDAVTRRYSGDSGGGVSGEGGWFGFTFPHSPPEFSERTLQAWIQPGDVGREAVWGGWVSDRSIVSAVRSFALSLPLHLSPDRTAE